MKKAFSLSIITPFFKSESYIEDCIKSLLNQDLEDVQYIFVNDGSPDKSENIVRRYARDDDRFLILKKENGGQSSARNLGIKYAKGDYILYVDSDDYLEPNVLGTMVKTAKDNRLDILRAVICDVFEGKKEQIDELDAPGTVMSGRERLSHNKLSYSLCANMYRREFLIDNNITFLEGVFHEDMDYVPRSFYYAERVMDLDLFFYDYVTRNGSTTNHYSQKRLEDVYKVAEHVDRFVIDEVDEESYEEFFKEFLAFMYGHIVNLCILCGYDLKAFLGNDNRRVKVIEHISKSQKKKYKFLSIMLKFRLYGLYSKLYLKREKKNEQ